MRAITELCAASLRVHVDDIDGKIELIQATPIALLPSTTAIIGYIDPANQQVVDQRDLLAAYVTPNAPAILELLHRSRLLKAQGDARLPDGRRRRARTRPRDLHGAQCRADHLYRLARGLRCGVWSVDSADRLPRESIECRSANCIDGTVLMASLLEATGIDPMIVLVPGHAYLEFRPDPKMPTTYEYVETTLIGTKPFEEACAVASARTAKGLGLGQLKHLDVRMLRDAGITPME